jgi:hypothetical protein
MTQSYNPQFGAPVQQPMPAQSGYPAQQYGQVPLAQQLPTPQQPLASGTLDDFFDQPTVGGGQALKFDTLGRAYDVTVSRPITKADIQQQTDTRGIPQFFRDGRAKFQMIVPCVLPDGSAASWYVKGATREKLAAAMSAAGAPAGPPEAGARMRLTYAADVPTGAGFNPRKDIDVQYARPNGALPVDSPQAAANVVTEQVAQQFTQAPPAPVNVPPGGQQSYAPAPAAPVGHQPMAQQAPQPMSAAPASAGLPPMPEGLTPDQAAGYQQLLAQLAQQPQQG